MLTWSLATIAPNREEHVSRILSDLEMEHRVFLVREKAARGGKIIDDFRLAFPGYMFVKSHANVALVEDITGVLGFVKFADAIVDVSHTVADLEAEAEDSVLGRGNNQVFVSKFQPGAKIRMTAGVWSGLTGEFHQMVNREKAIVLLEFMGRQVPFTVDEAEIQVEVKNTKRKRSSRNFTRRRHELSGSGVGVTS